MAVIGKAERTKFAGLERKCGGTLDSLKRESDLALSQAVHWLAGPMPGAWKDGSSMERNFTLMWTVPE
jgi:hypothetical protein